MTIEQSKVLDIFKYIVSLLKKHNLCYYAAYGTILGAVRHKGFIPWDDDIDIFMPRADYNQLVNLKDIIIQDHYGIFSVDTTDNCYIPFTKIYDRESTLWEDKNFPYIIGRFVDIFPLDYSTDNEEHILKNINITRKRWSQYQASIVDVSFGDLLRYFFSGKKRRLLRAIKHYFVSYHKTLNSYKQCIDNYSMSRGNKCFYLTPLNQICVFETEWFDDVLEVPFEDTTIIIPKNYDAYLSLCYGEWKKLPPISKRNAHTDNMYYCNLDECLSLDEVKRIIKQR